MRERALGHDQRREATQSLGFIVGSCICLILMAVFATGALQRAVRPPVSMPDGQINPNDASTASLARLPGIGPTRARAIVAFRDHFQDEQGHGPVFRRAEDLAQVKGIGPVTIKGIHPWLRFDPVPADANEPPPAP